MSNSSPIFIRIGTTFECRFSQIACLQPSTYSEKYFNKKEKIALTPHLINSQSLNFIYKILATQVSEHNLSPRPRTSIKLLCFIKIILLSVPSLSELRPGDWSSKRFCFATKPVETKEPTCICFCLCSNVWILVILPNYYLWER